MRELETIQYMIDEESEVYAVVLLNNNDYIVLPTKYTSVTYRGKDTITNAYTNATTALEPFYTVRCTFRKEVDAVTYLKRTTQLGAITKAVLDLYKLKYPEVWI